MSASPDFMTGLMQMLQGQQGQQTGQGGIMGGLMSDPNGLLGLSLLANSNTPGGFGSLFGKSALQANEMQQQNQAQKLDMMQKMMSLGMTGQKMNAVNQYMNPGQPAQPGQSPGLQMPSSPAPQSAVPTSPTPPGMNAPTVAPQAGQQPAQPNPFDVPQGDYSSLPVGGHTAQQFKGLQFALEGDPAKAEESTRKLQLETAQASVKPRVALLDQVIKSDNPAQIVGASPQLTQLYKSAAAGYGVDPNQPTPDNVRRVMSARRNELASWADLPAEAPPVPLQTVNGALGSIYQKDPVTGKLTQVKGEEPLKDVIDPKTGLPTNVRASAAEGKQPFNQSLFGANNVNDQALQFAADTYRATGKFPTSMARNSLLQGKVLNKIAADAAASGDTAGAMAARAAGMKANGQALDQVTKQEAATTSYYNTLDKNLTALQELSGKVDSSGVPLLNKVYRAWQQGVTGDPETAKYVTYMKAAEGEYAKIQSGSLGNQGSTDAARKDAHDVINKFMSQGQLDGVADAMRGEGQNRLSSIREQKQALMGSLSGGAPSANGSSTPAGPKPPPGVPISNAKGWILHSDAKGRWAYVSADGKSFEAVK